MPSTTMTVTVTTMTCPTCGTPYGLSEAYRQARREDHKSWSCPNGHWLSYKGETDAEKAERHRQNAVARLEQAESQLTHTRDQLQATERSLAATKGVVTRMKKRVAAGVCPVGCRRHFADLQAHIETKHPGYDWLAADAEASDA